VHGGQVEVLELRLELLADLLAAVCVVEGGLGALELGVDPRAEPFSARASRPVLDLAPVVARRVGRVDQLDFLRRCSALDAEQVPDLVEELGPEPAMKLGVVALTQGDPVLLKTFGPAARLPYGQRTIDGRVECSSE
jgi:hypothetical protein